METNISVLGTFSESALLYYSYANAKWSYDLPDCPLMDVSNATISSVISEAELFLSCFLCSVGS